jgi:hypothetical protein
MSNLFKKVRIIHSPLETRYVVEQKPLLGFRWERIENYDYVTVPNTSSYGVRDLPPVAYEKAKKKAEILLARSVVWEQTNYCWYP